MVGYSISIAPNPATEVLFISLEGTMEVNYVMYTEEGRVVIANSLLTNNGTELNVSNLASGMYFLRFTSANGSMTKKVIIR